jgi:hypothetical protein
MISLCSLCLLLSSVPFNSANQIIVRLFIWILHWERYIYLLHNGNSHIHRLSTSIRLIRFGLWQSSEQDSGLFIIVPLILLLYLSFWESRVIWSTVLSDISHFFAVSLASSPLPSLRPLPFLSFPYCLNGVWDSRGRIMLWPRSDNFVNILPNWVVGHDRQIPKRGSTGDTSLRQYNPINESPFPNSMNNHHADRRRGVSNWGSQTMGRIEENSFPCRKCASANWEKISVGEMPGEPVMDLLLFEVSDVTNERQWREPLLNSIFVWNNLHPLREMNKPTRNSCVVSHGNGELRRENAWQSSDGREKSIASG